MSVYFEDVTGWPRDVLPGLITRVSALTRYDCPSIQTWDNE
jgi:hypothetical protein